MESTMLKISDLEAETLTPQTSPAQSSTGSLPCFWKFNYELNRCYACVNVDYGADYNELSYEAFFNTADDGSRQIDCSSNAQQNGDSLCSCDAKFAQRIVQTENHCDVSFFYHFWWLSHVFWQILSLWIGTIPRVLSRDSFFRAESCFLTWVWTTVSPKCTGRSPVAEATSAQWVQPDTLTTTNVVVSTPTDSRTTKIENAAQQSKIWL